MEKKGDILNQLAIIADLLDRANLTSKETSVIFDLDKSEFERMYKIIKEKAKFDTKPKNTFQLKIEDILFIFNTNNA